MSLTKDDLKAIQQLIETSEKRLMERLTTQIIARINELDDTLSLQAGKGFNEMQHKIAAVDDHIGRVERIVQAEVSRIDQHETMFGKLRKAIGTA